MLSRSIVIELTVVLLLVLTQSCDTIFHDEDRVALGDTNARQNPLFVHTPPQPRTANKDRDSSSSSSSSRDSSSSSNTSSSTKSSKSSGSKRSTKKSSNSMSSKGDDSSGSSNRYVVIAKQQKQATKSFCDNTNDHDSMNRL